MNCPVRASVGVGWLKDRMPTSQLLQLSAPDVWVGVFMREFDTGLQSCYCFLSLGFNLEIMRDPPKI